MHTIKFPWIYEIVVPVSVVGSKEASCYESYCCEEMNVANNHGREEEAFSLVEASDEILALANILITTS